MIRNTCSRIFSNIMKRVLTWMSFSMTWRIHRQGWSGNLSGVIPVSGNQIKAIRHLWSSELPIKVTIPGCLEMTNFCGTRCIHSENKMGISEGWKKHSSSDSMATESGLESEVFSLESEAKAGTPDGNQLYRKWSYSKWGSDSGCSRLLLFWKMEANSFSFASRCRIRTRSARIDRSALL